MQETDFCARGGLCLRLQQYYFATVFLLLIDIVALVLGCLGENQYVWTDELDERVWLFLGRLEGNSIDVAEVRKDEYAFLLIYDRPVRTLAFTHLGVAVDSDYQQVTLLLCFFEIFSVTDMEKIERPGSEYDAETKLLPVLHKIA